MVTLQAYCLDHVKPNIVIIKRFLLISCILLFNHYTFSQGKSISGFVRDHSSGEKLINANVFTVDNRLGTVCNN